MRERPKDEEEVRDLIRWWNGDVFVRVTILPDFSRESGFGNRDRSVVPLICDEIRSRGIREHELRAYIEAMARVRSSFLPSSSSSSWPPGG